MRILISGGGTSGHINPAIALANYMRKKDKNIQIAFAGTEKGIENKLVPKEGYKLYHLKVKGFKRKLALENISAAVYAFTSRFTAGKIIKDFNPDIVVGTGGYVSWPVLSVAAKKKIPTIIHEQNAFPGVTTKMLAQSVDKVMISFEESRKYFKEKNKLVFTGNPVKEEFFTVDAKDAKHTLSPGKFMILSYGGSMGADKINENIIEFMDRYSKNKNINHYHGTGALGYKKYSEVFAEKELGGYKNLHIQEYLYDMHKYMAAADIIICRSGAVTLAELAALRKAAILIPSPNVTESHQYKNAAVLEKKNAAVVVEEKNLTPELLIKITDELLSDPFKISEMAQNIGSFANRGVLEKMYICVKSLYKKRNI